jgi:hypothetical protein
MALREEIDANGIRADGGAISDVSPEIVILMLHFMMLDEMIVTMERITRLKTNVPGISKLS